MDQDPRTTARTAREGLARGLNLLQDPNLPPPFLQAAEPIAKAMGALMQAERSDGHSATIRPHAEAALASVRDALARLQALPAAHPAAEQATGAVAGSLGLVHALTRHQSVAPPPAPGFQPQAPAYAAPQAPPQQQWGAPQQQAYQPPPQPQFQPPPQPQYQPPPQQYQPPAQQQYQPPQQQQFQPPPQQQAAPALRPQPQVYQGPPPAQQAAPPMARPAPMPDFNRAPAAPAASPAPIGAGESIGPPPAGTVEAELGAHSPSNFYKTLSGNDIVDHGGIFVSTYNIPRMGAQIMLRVHLPGGYHFDSRAVVRWTREARDNPDAPPGFGAQFQGITGEQRQLIQRYVRNREPLFYDDL